MGWHGLARWHAGTLRVNPHRVNEHRVNEHRVNEHRVNEHRVNPHRVNPTGPAGDPPIPGIPKEACVGEQATLHGFAHSITFFLTLLYNAPTPL
jgi:hypothetical protein